MGIQELLRPGAQFSFSPQVAHSCEDPIKLPPDSGALHRPSYKLCIPSHVGVSRLCKPMHPGQPAVSSSVPEGLHHLVADSDTSPCSRTFQRVQEGRAHDTFIFGFASPFFPIFISWETAHPFYSSEFKGDQMEVERGSCMGR